MASKIVEAETKLGFVQAGALAQTHAQLFGLSLARSDGELTPYWLFAGAPGRTAATPSGLMLNARNVNGASPGFPH